MNQTFKTVATVSRSGTGYAIGNVKRYDVWGKVRSDSGTGSSGQILDPNTRYCGNLGHKFDSTSGLTYMRARYYEAETGRFISEDPARDGANWFQYVRNSPCSRVDPNGREDMAEFLVANGMQSGMQSAGVSSIVGNVQIVENALMVDVQMIQGASGATQGALQVLRQWAVGNGINEIFIQGTIGSTAGRGATMLALQAISNMGDRGELLTNNVYTIIYWLLQA